MILKGKTQADVDKDKRIAEMEAVILEAKRSLAETDWVVIKLNEYRITNSEEYNAMLEKYQPVLDARERRRQDINYNEEELRNMGAL